MEYKYFGEEYAEPRWAGLVVVNSRESKNYRAMEKKIPYRGISFGGWEGIMSNSNSNSKKWKSKLLSSSLPLEFEAAKIRGRLRPRIADRRAGAYFS